MFYEFGQWLRKQDDERIERYIACPANALDEIDWYLHIHRTTEEIALVEFAEDELKRRRRRKSMRLVYVGLGIVLATASLATLGTAD